MKHKPIFRIACLAIMAVGAISVAGQFRFAYPSISQILFSSEPTSQKAWLADGPDSKRPAILQKTEEQNEEVPDKIVFFILFNHLVGLKEQAEKAAEKGESLNYLGMYEEQANLNNAQSQFLFQTAQDCMDAIKPINDEAKEIITKAQANFPKGEVKSPEDLPPPPQELKELQQRKDDVVLRFRDVLKDGLGTQKFGEFNDFARQKIAPQVTTNLNPTRQEEK